MCLASRYVSQIESTLINLKGDMKKLSLKMSQYDKEVNEIYHKIEIAKFNACEGYYLAKNLQDTLQKRRLIKSEYFRMEQLHKNLAQSLTSRLDNAKGMIEKSKSHSKEWQSHFSITFSDIENEVLH